MDSDFIVQELNDFVKHFSAVNQNTRFDFNNRPQFVPKIHMRIKKTWKPLYYREKFFYKKIET